PLLRVEDTLLSNVAATNGDHFGARVSSHPENLFAGFDVPDGYAHRMLDELHSQLWTSHSRVGTGGTAGHATHRLLIEHRREVLGLSDHLNRQRHVLFRGL